MTLPPWAADSIVDSVKRALQEDIGEGDLTAQLIKESVTAKATIISRQPAVFCGRPWASEVFSQLSHDINQSWKVQDGDEIQEGQSLCELSGPSRPLLSGERTALNFLQTLSGTATRTRQFVSAVKGTNAKILDTRKTIPGLRLAQKYAVTCGGGENHRLGLFDGILIKENHIEASGSLENAIADALSINANLLVELEVESLDQLRKALDAGVKRLLLDNMTIEQLKQAVEITNKRARLEASGGVTINNVLEIAETGVDYISIGDITKNIDAVDLSLRFDY
jgi:nicotinate-nucleotide pyrophosphorylase (carboxylating)